MIRESREESRDIRLSHTRHAVSLEPRLVTTCSPEDGLSVCLLALSPVSSRRLLI